MAFNLRAGSADIMTPVHIFDGDNLSPELYRQTIFNGYITSVSTIYGAARGYGLDIDSETCERWKRIGAAAGLLDDYLDTSPDFRTANMAYNEGLSALFCTMADSFHIPDESSKSLDPAITLLRNSITTMPEANVRSLMQAAKFIGNIAVTKSQCSDITMYIQQLKEEAFYSSQLIYDSASDFVRDQPNYYRFSQWCVHAIQLGTLVDSTWDLWTDKKQDRTGIEASVPNACRIVREIRPAVAGMLKQPADRHATVMALLARRRFSLQPTRLLMKRSGK